MKYKNQVRLSWIQRQQLYQDTTSLIQGHLHQHTTSLFHSHLICKYWWLFQDKITRTEQDIFLVIRKIRSYSFSHTDSIIWTKIVWTFSTQSEHKIRRLCLSICLKNHQNNLVALDKIWYERSGKVVTWSSFWPSSVHYNPHEIWKYITLYISNGRQKEVAWEAEDVERRVTF